MATQAYWDWVAAGRPFRRPPWLQELKARAAAAGVPFLGDLGSDDVRHLQAAVPQDHCPFSATAYPVPLPDYVICAIDNGRGPWSYRILAAARAGAAPWLKYMNVDGRNYSRRRGAFMVPVVNADIHQHLSGMSDHTWHSVGAFNPYVEGDPMTDPNILHETDDSYEVLTWRAEALAEGRESVVGGPRTGEPMRIVTMVREVAEAVAEIQTTITSGVPVAMTPEDRDAIVDSIRGEIASTVEATVRRVLGGLDNPVVPE